MIVKVEFDYEIGLLILVLLCLGFVIVDEFEVVFGVCVVCFEVVIDEM